jgi:2-polyprenyl-3-methyl-5-hydroxy-6-metoxy-1,4-benzoquinol methylase
MQNNHQTVCRLCGKEAHLVEDFCQGYIKDDFYKVYFCESCNTSFVYNSGDVGDIYNLIYRYAEKVPGYDRYYRYANAIKNEKNPLDFLALSEEAYWMVKDALSKNDKPKDETFIIEAGSGLGYLTYALNTEGYKALGIDISQNAVEKAIKNFGSNYICANIHEYAEKHQNQYDIVVLTEVIEHIEEPIEFLGSLCLMLKQGGRIILSTPNKTIYPANVLWATDLPPVHLWWFSETSMRYIGNMLGMNTVFTDFSNYYKNRQSFISLKWDKNSLKPVFNSGGEQILIVEKAEIQKTSPIKVILKKIPLLVYAVRKIKIWKRYIFRCEISGPTLGVIFEKNKLISVFTLLCCHFLKNY